MRCGRRSADRGRSYRRGPRRRRVLTRVGAPTGADGGGARGHHPARAHRRACHRPRPRWSGSLPWTWPASRMSSTSSATPSPTAAPASSSRAWPGTCGRALPSEHEQALATAPADDLLGLPFLGQIADSGSAYGISKRANHLRVAAASVAWGSRGARINSISPGVISTPMGQQELASDSGAIMRAMVDSSGTGRLGTPDDIAAAAAFLLSPDSSFITGVDCWWTVESWRRCGQDS